MGLRSLVLQDSYRSGRDQLARDFFIPCLSEATSYNRAVGFFTSGSLSLVAIGIRRLADRGGSIRVIASPRLSGDDLEQIRLGYALRDIIARAVSRELYIDEKVERARLGYLGRLIAQGSLDIKIALVNTKGRLGMYHEKVGIMVDDSGDAVSFSGSMNETAQAHLLNFESFEVYRSWDPADARRVARHMRDFEALWNDETPHVQVLDLPEAAREVLESLAQGVRADFDPSSDDEDQQPFMLSESIGFGQPTIPRGLELRDYQRSAVASWFKNDGRGTLKMATGTGKTYTALAAAAQLFRVLHQHSRPMLTIVVCPYQHLVDQWALDVRAFGVQPICCYESFSSWAPTVESLLPAINSGAIPHIALICTVATFRGEHLPKILSKVSISVLLIADEVHNMGAAGVLAVLPQAVRYRLALSATPERWFDDEGTASLFEYFGATVFELTLGEAIAMGALSEYRYSPVPVQLDAEESDLYFELTVKISRLLQGSGEPSDDQGDEMLGALLRKRAAVLAHCSAKLGAFRGAATARRDAWYQLVYCGEGRPPQRPSEPSQVDSIIDLLGNQLLLPVDRYVSETPRDERRRLLERFASGSDLKFLVSMRCLDEGVDLPDARVAYLLASSSNPRQFIQRRGRILRLPSDGSRKVAEIVDFVAVPSRDPSTGPVAETEQRLLRRELQRVVDFARLAVNGPEALSALLDIRTRYHLLDM